MLPKKQRITKKEDFNKLYKKGFVSQSDCLKVFVLKNTLNFNRFSVIVSKKVSPKAVKRNSIKRKLKNMLSGLDKKISPSLDILILALPCTEKLKNFELEKKFKELFKKIKL